MTLLPALLAACLLLVVSGAAKLRNPRPAAAALRALGVPAATLVVPVAAVVELAAGVAGIAAPRTALFAGALYVVFACLVGAQLARGSTASCGCLGSADTPPSPLHLVIDAALAATAFAAAFSAPPGIVSLLGAHPAAGAVVAAASATAAFLLVSAASLLPAALASYRRPA
jgi:hypothetical protein